MAARSAFAKFGKTDFFAVLPTGFFIFLALALFFSPDLDDGAKHFWEQLSQFTGALKANPAYLLFVLFASYIIGSVFRAFPVEWAAFPVPPYGKDRTGFPYPDFLLEKLEVLNDNVWVAGHDPTKTPIITQAMDARHLKTIFNFWKNVMCVQEPEAYDEYKTYEARSRFFTGMFWAGLAGVITGIAIFFRVGSMIHYSALELTVSSLVLILFFGFQLRRVREQEAKTLLFMYVTYLQKQS